MAKDKGGAPAANNGPAAPAGSTSCCVEKCTKKSDRMNFCPEHYMWFKEGLVNKKGLKPMDFDKKYQAFMTKKAA